MPLTNLIKKTKKKKQQMAANDGRLDARPRQTITARKNQLGNETKEQDSPQRAKPTAKSEPFKSNKETMGVKDAEVKDESDDENPETTHESKGKRGRPSNIREDQSLVKKKSPDHDTEKDMNRTRSQWREQQKDI